MSRTIVVIAKDKKGRSSMFRDVLELKDMSRQEFVRSIERGDYPDYYVRKMNGIATPVSKHGATMKEL